MPRNALGCVGNTAPLPTQAHNYSKAVARIDAMVEWSFLTNHGQALLCIAHDPGVRLREIAATLGVTERSAYSIVSDLTDAGYVLKEKDGRRNRYVVQQHLPVPGATIRESTVGEVLEILVGTNHRPVRSTAAKTTSKKSTKKIAKARALKAATKPRAVRKSNAKKRR